jgi:hypothetical protein
MILLQAYSTYLSLCLVMLELLLQCWTFLLANSNIVLTKTCLGFCYENKIHMMVRWGNNLIDELLRIFGLAKSAKI